MKFGIGQAVPRTEDLRLLTGRGRYLEDINLPGQAHAAVLRSPHAHARIAAIDVSEAASMPGVIAVLTGRDLEADGIAPLPCMAHVPAKAGTPDFLWVRALAIEAYYSDFVAPGAETTGAWAEIDFNSPLATRLAKDWSYLGIG